MKPSATLWQVRVGAVLTNCGFKRKGRCVVCNSRAHYEFGWEDFCLACTKGRLSDSTYEALGWDRPSSTIRRGEYPESPIRWLHIPAELAEQMNCPPGIWLFQPDIAETAEKWDSDMIRTLANLNIEVPR